MGPLTSELSLLETATEEAVPSVSHESLRAGKVTAITELRMSLVYFSEVGPALRTGSCHSCQANLIASSKGQLVVRVLTGFLYLFLVMKDGRDC